VWQIRRRFGSTAACSSSSVVAASCASYLGKSILVVCPQLLFDSEGLAKRSRFLTMMVRGELLSSDLDTQGDHDKYFLQHCPGEKFNAS
jgi:hypothetical protein